MSKRLEEFNRIGRYLLIEKTELRPANSAFIFGNRAIPQTLADHAALYYHQGYFPHIVVSGGVHCLDNYASYTEAELIKYMLTARGVPEKDITMENIATNTQENVEFVKNIFNTNAQLNNADKIISFGHIKASRRFMMTIKAHWPEIVNMHVGVNPYRHPVANWYMHDQFREAVLDQYERIDPYLKKGWITEIDLAEINRKILTMK